MGTLAPLDDLPTPCLLLDLDVVERNLLHMDASGALRSDSRLVSLSQEHGIVNAPLPVGSRVRILPNHSCLTVACFDEYQVVRGGEVVDRWKIWRGR